MSSLATSSQLLARAGEFSVRDGIVVGGADVPHGTTSAMRLMQSSVLARVYEQVWRPTIVGLVSSLSYETEDAVVDRHLPRRDGLKVLDLCCGTARASRRFVPFGAEVLGVDCSRAMLLEARRRCSDERLILLEGDAERQVARPEIFDAALCFAALHLMRDPSAVISAARAALRPGGLLFVWAAASRGLFGVAAVRGAARWTGLNPFSPGALDNMVVANGFEVVESLTSGVVEFVVARRL